MTRDDSVYLPHILDALGQVAEYTKGIDYDRFRATRMVQDAVIRQFEVVGEATKNLSADFRERHGALPWKDLAGFRDKLIHQYFGVDLATVWRSVVDDVPLLLEELKIIAEKEFSR